MIRQEKTQEAAAAPLDLAVIPFPAIGVDIDAPLDAQAIFVRALVLNWPGRIVAFSSKGEKLARAAMNRLKLRCDDLILAETPESKVGEISRSDVLAVISHDFVVLSQLPIDQTRLWIVT